MTVRPLHTLRTPLLALGLLALASACADDSIDAGSGGSGASSSKSSSSTLTGSGASSGTDSSVTVTSSGTLGNGGAGGSGAGQGGATGAGGLQPPTEVAPCQGHVYACGDLVDNDGDGLLDSLDPDCLGPCDNTEDSFFGGIPGQAGPACKVDCYFDQDSGAGNDDCYWTHECDPLSVDPTYYPEPAEGSACEYGGGDMTVPPTGKTCDELNAGQSQECHDYCGPLTPNGCDCFGCCELPAGSGSFVWLGSEGIDGSTVCSMADLGDPDVCHPCTPVADCLNDCKPCEICIGKPTLDPGCFSGEGGGSGSSVTGSTGTDTTTGSGAGGGTQECPTGHDPCGLPGQAPCGSGQSCITGCCYDVPN